MPPRVSPHHVHQPVACQCFRTRPRQAQAASQSAIVHTRHFHPSPSTSTRLRRNMFAWLDGPGKVFRNPLPNSTNYLSAYDKGGNLLRGRQEDLGQQQSEDLRLDESEETRATSREAAGLPRERIRDLRPYPLNKNFMSQAVLSEELRQRIYELVEEQGYDLKAVSAGFQVDIRRVAAVVRLMAVEKQWVKEGKPLAKAYNKAVLGMLPTTPFLGNNRNPLPHEPINDLPVHPWTRQQVFVPTSESRAFTRADAAKTFHPTLLPADERIPNPELVQIEKWELEGYDRETRTRLRRKKDTEEAMRREQKEKRQKEWEKRTQVVVPGRRWDFKFQDISAEKTGKDGRGQKAVGIRYGMPHEDRKKGQIKIPTQVE